MELLQQAVNGITQGAIYALIALGYTMVYGVLRFINFAHGDVYMLGAFAGLYASQKLGVMQVLQNKGAPTALVVILIFLISMGACALIGALIERLAYKPLRDSPRLTVLITAIGVSILLENGAQAVSPDPQGFPQLISSNPIIDTPDFRLTWVPVTIIAVAVGLMLALQFIIQKTALGRAMRAVALDRSAASLMGINTNAVITFTFALGSALAAAAGVLNSVYQPTIDPLMGINVGLKAFVAAVLGGIGSIPGAVLGGLILGIAETAVKSVPQLSPFSDSIAFAILIVVLIWKPAGIMGHYVPEKV